MCITNRCKKIFVCIPTFLIFDFTVIRDELKTDLGFYAKGYGDILLRCIGVGHPRVIYASGGKFFLLINFCEVKFQQKI